MAKTKNKLVTKDKKEDILASARKIIALKGIKETSLGDIAKDLGISKGTLYYYYSAKADIIYDIADNHLNQISNELLIWINKINDTLSKEEILTTVIDRLLEAEERGKIHLYLLGDAITGNQSLKNRFNQRYAVWRKNIEEGLKKVVSNHYKNHKLVAYLILLIIDGLTIQKLLGQVDLQVVELSKMIMNIN